MDGVGEIFIFFFGGGRGVGVDTIDYLDLLATQSGLFNCGIFLLVLGIFGSDLWVTCLESQTSEKLMISWMPDCYSQLKYTGQGYHSDC